MDAKQVVKAWLQGSGHSEQQAEVFFEHSKYQYLVSLIEAALVEGARELTEEEQLEQAFATLYSYPEVRQLVSLVEKKLNAED